MKRTTASILEEVQEYGLGFELFNLGKKLEVNDQNCEGDTPLHVVMRWADLEAAAILIEAGADPTIPGDMDITPLDMAVLSGNTAMQRVLLSKGVDPAVIERYRQMFSPDAHRISSPPQFAEWSSIPHLQLPDPGRDLPIVSISADKTDPGFSHVFQIIQCRVGE
jgi:ankyrin repeat protein